MRRAISGLLFGFLVALLALGPVPAARAEIIQGSGGASSAVNGSGVSTVGLTAPSFTSTAAANATGFACQTSGCRYVLDTATPVHISYSAGTGYVTIAGANFSTGSIRAGSTGTGSFEGTALTVENPVQSLFIAGRKSNTADGSPGVRIYNRIALTNANTQIAAFYADATAVTQQLTVEKDGNLSWPQACDSTGTPGNATCDRAAGRAAIAGAATSVTITNAIVTATSIVTANLQTNDATCTAVRSVIPAAGSFTLHVPAACTGTTNFGWVVFN